MKIVQSGATRIVFLLGGYAIKCPRLKSGWKLFVQGLCCNMSEAECWKITGSEWLCPVLWSWAGFILVMPRIEILKPWDEIPQIHLDGDGCDHSTNNYGRYMGRVVCVDYPYYRLKPYKR